MQTLFVWLCLLLKLYFIIFHHKNTTKLPKLPKMYSTIEILKHARISEVHCSLKHYQFRDKQEAGNENHLKLIAVSSYLYWPQTVII